MIGAKYRHMAGSRYDTAPPDGLPELLRKSPDRGVFLEPLLRQPDVCAAQGAVKPLRQHRFMSRHDELVVGSRFRQSLAHGQGVAGAGQGDIWDRGPHRALIRIGAAEPTA
jgi:hypothetical protein